jgi:Ca2+-binding RTX toxin-like protein
MAVIDGTPGNDSGVNALIGTEFDDTISGFAGDDEIFGLGGNDIIDGGSGNDTITDNVGDNEIFGGSGNDVIDVSGGDGDNFIVPGTGDDTIIGNSDANGSGFTFLSYWGLNFGITVDLVAGTTTGTGKSDTFSNVFSIRGTDFNDVLHGGNNDDYEGFAGMAGNDLIDGGSGYDEILFHLEKGSGAVHVDFKTGRAIDTYGNMDTFSNIEAVRASPQDDTLLGDKGFQSFRGLDGDDYIDGFGGFDRADYSFDARYGGTNGVNVTLWSGVAIDGFGATDTLVNIEWVRGTGFSDQITGNNHDNRLEGLGGNDTLTGDAGDDVLIGGRGDDTLIGNRGKDTFVFKDGDGSDEIVSFGEWRVLRKVLSNGEAFYSTVPEADTIDLSGHSAASDYADIAANAQQVGNNVEITLGADMVTLQDFDLINLDAGDFVF